MPSKSKKTAGKKGQSKKAPKSKAPPKKAVVVRVKRLQGEVEEVSEVPNLMPPEVVKELSTIEKQAALADDMSVNELLDVIEIYSDHAARSSQIAIKAGVRALAYAWGCGKMLNAAKEKLGKLGKGEFGKWRSANLVPKLMSERTSARYMLLAARFRDVRPLLQWAPTLRQAYIACGILPDFADGQEKDPEKEDVPRKQILFTSLNHLQRNLRLFERNLQEFEKSKEKLDASEKVDLQLVKYQIGQFTDRIVKLLP